SVKLGTPAQPNGTYSWAPTAGLDNPNVAQPIFSPTATGTYLFTLTVSTAGVDCPTKDYVKVVVKPNPNINLGPDKYLCPSQTSTTISVASYPPGTHLQWQPDKLSNLNYTLNPDPFFYRNINYGNSNYTTRFVASTEMSGPWTWGEAYHADGYYGSGWKSAINDANQWVRYDMGRDTVVVRISTRGKGQYWTCCPWVLQPDCWVTSYQLDYSRDGVNWTVYKENGNPVTFTGNTNATTEVTHDLNEPFYARYVRIRPITWSAGGIGLRFTLFAHHNLGARFNGWEVTPVTSQNVKPGTFIVHASVPGCSNRLSDTITVHAAMPIPMHYRTHSNGNWANDATWQVLNENNMTWVHVPALDPCYNVHWPDWTKKTILVRDSVD
ncbi:MAG: discoidin domain-containing protein, partial [Bacteroidia bacterium]|nr:discoidin domain-containing protein [Bacteroidia bacterium]